MFSDLGRQYFPYYSLFNPLNAKLNPICHLMALLGAHYIFHVSRLRVKEYDIVETLVKVWNCIILKLSLRLNSIKHSRARSIVRGWNGK
jgi:hypothetical protein